MPVVPWLARHPMSAVFITLALLGGTAWGIAAVFAPGPTPPERPMTVESGVAESVLPKPTQFPPRERVDRAHRALHAMARACKQPVATRDPDAVRRPVAMMEKFARDYPRGGFTIDDESGSTLTLLIVVRNELEACDPALIPRIDALIPPQHRP